MRTIPVVAGGLVGASESSKTTTTKALDVPRSKSSATALTVRTYYYVAGIKVDAETAKPIYTGTREDQRTSQGGSGYGPGRPVE